MRFLVTGGAGFIGSHLVERLLDMGYSVTVFDNLSSGHMENLRIAKLYENFDFIKGDLCEISSIENALEGCNGVFHLAANPEVRTSKASTIDHFNQNILGTFNLLEAIRNFGDVKFLGFSSTSTVYGEPSVIPTPVTYGPLKPISNYGASKLAGESMICSYASMYDFRAAIFRLANVIGIRSDHGIIYDFIQKLRANPYELEVLGDGRQSKSYLYIDDCVSGFVTSMMNPGVNVEIFNLGSDDQYDVMGIANIVIQEMGLSDVTIRTTGGVDGGRGWKGDVKTMQLDMTHLKEMGWNPIYSSSEAIRLTTRALISV